MFGPVHVAVDNRKVNIREWNINREPARVHRLPVGVMLFIMKRGKTFVEGAAENRLIARDIREYD